MTNEPKPTDMVSYNLLANFVHQVINPLNGVAGTLDNLASGVVPHDRQVQRTRAARAQLEQAILLLRNLAYFSELTGDQTQVDSRRVRKVCVIPQIIIEAAMFFQELGNSKGIRIELDDKETQYRVEGNPDLLRQVFMNLFDNAVKYGQDNTVVHVTPWIQKHLERTAYSSVRNEYSNPRARKGADLQSRIQSSRREGSHRIRDRVRALDLFELY